MRRNAVIGFATLALLAALAPLGGCGGGGAESAERQVIMIMLDAARPDRFSCYGYGRETTPRMDALAETGLMFENHYAQATYTRASLPQMFYSRYFAKPMFPSSPSIPLTEPADLFRVPDAQTVSLARTLSENGFRSAVVSAHPWIKPGTTFADDFDELHDLTEVLEEGRLHADAETMVDRCLSWLEENIERDYFLYIHMMDTHTPHYFDEDAQAYFGSRPYIGNSFDSKNEPLNVDRPMGRMDKRYLNALYDGSMRYNDRELGRLFDYLAEQGRLENTLIVITADHGEHLMEVTGRYGHQCEWHDAVARIPLIVHYPARLGPSTVSAPSEGVDLLPTMLGLLDVPIPADKSTDGIDLVPYARGETAAKPFVMAPQSIRSDRFKCLFTDPDAVLLAEPAPAIADLTGQLYEVSEDALETRDLWAARPEVVHDMFDAYRAAMGPRYTRYQAAVSFAQPKVPFALGTDHARIEADLSEVERSPLAEDLTAADGPRWLRSVHDSKHWLLGRQGAEPARLEIAVPSGEYRLSAHIMGRGTLQVDGSDEVFTVSASTSDLDLFTRLRETHVGYINIRDDVFRATIAPAPGADGFFLRMFGFSPVAPDEDVAENQALDEARIERLRSLGYVD